MKNYFINNTQMRFKEVSMAKRIFDIVASLIGLVILSSIMLVIALVIKIVDRGPVFYKGIRAGLWGENFKIYKFRTMVEGAEKLGGSCVPDDDPRITNVGRFLRKYKLDELPQLFNVLKGDMSLVGPRPEVPEYISLLSDEGKEILSVKPGITDWASLWDIDEGAFLSGCKNPEKKYLEEIKPVKTRLQIKYVRNKSFLVDIKIIILTILSVITRKRIISKIDFERY